MDIQMLEDSQAKVHSGPKIEHPEPFRCLHERFVYL